MKKSRVCKFKKKNRNVLISEFVSNYTKIKIKWRKRSWKKCWERLPGGRDGVVAFWEKQKDERTGVVLGQENWGVLTSHLLAKFRARSKFRGGLSVGSKKEPDWWANIPLPKPKIVGLLLIFWAYKAWPSYRLAMAVETSF